MTSKLHAAISSDSLLKRGALWLIRFYQVTLSPLLGANCRFQPTCSCYMAEAISTHGLKHGAWLGMRRISRCHPWNPGGYDPVPPVKSHNTVRHGI